MGELLMAAYLPLLAIDAVAVLVIYVAQRHRWANWVRWVFLGLNTRPLQQTEKR
jgi:hypothetical protein